MLKKPLIKNSIFSRLLFAFMLTVLIPAFLFSIVSTWSSYQIAKQRTIDQLTSISELKTFEIDFWTSQLLSNLNSIFSEEDLSEIVYPLLGDQLSVDERNKSQTILIRKLHYEISQNNLFTDIALLNLEGKVIASTNSAIVGMDLSQTSFYQGGLQKEFISPPFQEESDIDSFKIIAAEPVILKESGAVGVLVGYSDLSILDQIMEGAYNQDQSGESYLVNQDYLPVTDLKNQAGNLNRYIDSEGIYNAIETKVSGSGLYDNYYGIPVIGVHAWLPVLQVALIVEQTQAQAFASTIEILKMNLLMAFSAVLITILVAYGLAANIASPIRQLAESTTKISTGDLSSMVIVNRKDEIGSLAESFNQMIIRLKGLIDQLRNELAERKKFESALRISEDKFRYVFEHSPVGKSITFTSGEIHVNEAFAQMLGYLPAELEHKNWQEITHPDDLESSVNITNAMMKGKFESFRWIKRYLHKNGSVIWTDISTSLRWDESGKPLYFISTIMDISERKAAEEEIIRLNADLEKRVEQRTHQLEEANKEMEAFAYSVSHDLRAPLRAMDGFSNILIHDYADQLNDNGKKYLRRIHDATELMSQLIEDLLNLSRINRYEVQNTKVDLSWIAGNIIDALKRKTPERHVEYKVFPSMLVNGDEHLLRIALENLISNAHKFTSKCDQAKIVIGVKRVGEEDVFFVKDNGSGFDMAYADKLFMPFQRLHAATDFPGTGIGLVIVARIITRHGGRVWTKAAPNKGATFFFTLGKQSLEKNEK